MNPAQIENILAQAIADRTVSLSDRFCIVCDDTLIMCIPAREMKLEYHHIANYTYLQLIDGFTPKEWSMLVEKIQRWLRFKI